MTTRGRCFVIISNQLHAPDRDKPQSAAECGDCGEQAIACAAAKGLPSSVLFFSCMALFLWLWVLGPQPFLVRQRGCSSAGSGSLVRCLAHRVLGEGQRTDKVGRWRHLASTSGRHFCQARPNRGMGSDVGGVGRPQGLHQVKCCEGCKLCLRTAVGADVWRMPNCARKDENRKVEKLLKKSRFCAKNPKSRKAAKAKLCKTRKVEKSPYQRPKKNNSWNTSESILEHRQI